MERSGVVSDELSFVALTLRYFERLAEEVQFRAGSLRYTEFFTRQHYKLEHTDFTVQGWELRGHSPVHTVSFRRVAWSDIVANRVAKHQFRRFAIQPACFATAGEL